jgi:hypothetical protein
MATSAPTTQRQRLVDLSFKYNGKPASSLHEVGSIVREAMGDTRIVRIALGCNGIDSAALMHLAAGFDEIHTTEDISSGLASVKLQDGPPPEYLLDLSANTVGDQGTMALVQLLGKHGGIKAVELRANQVSECCLRRSVLDCIIGRYAFSSFVALAATCAARDAERYRDTEIQRYRHREIQRCRDTEMQRDRDRGI